MHRARRTMPREARLAPDISLLVRAGSISRLKSKARPIGAARLQYWAGLFATQGTLFDLRVHGNHRGAGNRRPLPRCLDDKSIASFISTLRRVFVGGCVEPFQLAM